MDKMFPLRSFVPVATVFGFYVVWARRHQLGMAAAVSGSGVYVADFSR